MPENPSISEALVNNSQQIQFLTVGGGLLATAKPPSWRATPPSIRSYPPHLEAISSIHNLSMCHAVVTRDPLNLAKVKLD
jgi:hypothetical protein